LLINMIIVAVLGLASGICLALLSFQLGVERQKQKRKLLCPWTGCKYNKNNVCVKEGTVLLRDYGDEHAPLLSCSSIETEKKPATKPTKTINSIV
jgi:hypothetical protein